MRPENFREFYQLLREAGYTTTDPIDGNQRHVLFNKGRVLIELHRRFATLQTKKLENLLDEWIYEGINTHVIEQIQRYSFPRLDDTLNGLVLLTHINQHLEEGLGLRQILDWIMYCNKNLSDETWPEFKKKTDQLGLTTLAKVTARLGQKYFGLKEDAITWCRSADEKTVDDFLEYVFSCGNFGQKDSINNTVVMVMVHGRGVRGFFRNLQRQGKINWKALEKHKWLTSFAWLYQMCRYVRLGLKINNCKEFLVNYNTSKQRSKLLDKLEVTRTAHKTGN